jgi:hypothetical protein
MKVPIEKIVEKAEDTLSDAVFNFESTRYEAAINRSYYAVFYCISALLEAKQANTKTHQGAHNKFNELYLKTKLLPSTLNTSLDIVFSLRQSGDYDLRFEPTEEDAATAIEHAREFLAATKKHFDTQLLA